jgi:hypothetical protein
MPSCILEKEFFNSGRKGPFVWVVYDARNGMRWVMIFPSDIYPCVKSTTYAYALTRADGGLCGHRVRCCTTWYLNSKSIMTGTRWVGLDMCLPSGEMVVT